MRIVGGEWGGRILASPGPSVRPTQDRVRQILFDILGERITQGAVCDLYAGSGALGLEALSRGAPMAVLVEKDPAVRRVLLRNCRSLGAGDRVRVLGIGVSRALSLLLGEGMRFHWVLMDPPYGDPEVARVLSFLGGEGSALFLDAGGVVLESRSSDPVGERYGLLARARERRAGGTCLHFFARTTAPAQGSRGEGGAKG